MVLGQLGVVPGSATPTPKLGQGFIGTKAEDDLGEREWEEGSLSVEIIVMVVLLWDEVAEWFNKNWVTAQRGRN